MTTLPPEGSDPIVPGDQPVNEPAAPEAPLPPVPPQQASTPPAAPAPPQVPAPPQAPQFQQAPAGGYEQPAGGQVPPGGYQQQYAQQPAAGPVSNIQLNYWLSAFFSWIPALIFFIIEKDKGDRRAYEYHRDNLNFSLLRTIVGFTAWIPYIGWFIAIVGGIVLFVFHIMAAAKATDAFRAGQPAPFIFNLPLVK